MYSLVQMPASVVGMSCQRTLKHIEERREQIKGEFRILWGHLSKLLERAPTSLKKAAEYFEGDTVLKPENAGGLLLVFHEYARQKELESLVAMAKAAPPNGPMMISSSDFQVFKEGFDELISEARLMHKLENLPSLGQEN